ncbi:uncharacterized protein LOC132718522 [Ruditapes philippinarum]|uniref:uncharacterized protein LOC132718522 n=1 Tax=Ruditapes philippinarum TaxID=129788 RepID=UPI00295B9B97|nr:uncharacterized protein LOC132718522 [Ruditapes philippinarum]
METQLVEATEDVTVDSDEKCKEIGDENETPTFDFTEKTWKDDFVLIVENKRLHVAKAILAYASPVFDTMFQAEFKEKGASELELPGKKVEDLQQFLRCIYPLQAEISFENVNAVLPLADEYQVSNLKSKCEAFLLRQVNGTISSDELYRVLEQASLYNMTSLLQNCVDVASGRKVESFHRAEKILKIKPEVKCMILDRMVSRLQPKNFLEVLKRYYESYLEPKYIPEIKDYKDWDGNLLKITFYINKWKSFKVCMHGIEANCVMCIVDTSFESSIFKVKRSTTGAEVQKIKMFGRIVIKPISGEHSEKKSQINFEYSSEQTDIEVKIPTLRCSGGIVANFPRSGYVYHGKLDVELLLLAKKLDLTEISN